MDERAAVAEADDEPLADRLSQRSVHLLLRAIGDDREDVDLRGAPDAGSELEGFPRRVRQAPELPHHEIDDVVGEALGLDPRDVPDPRQALRIERHQLLLVQRGQELVDEEGIAAGLVVHEPRELADVLGALVDRVGDQLGHVLRGERRHHDLAHPRAARTGLLEHQRQRMGGPDLVVAERADEEEIPRVRMREEVGEEIEAGRIHPLEIIEEDGHGVRRAGEHPEELPEHPVKAILRVDEGQLGDGRLPPDDQLDLGDHLGDELPIDPEGLEELPPEDLYPVLALGEDLEHQLPQRLDRGGMRDVALVRIELPRDEKAALPEDRFVQLVDQR
ncbi:MAG: hypothetical protein QM820_48085 [Minicystis sp.]